MTPPRGAPSNGKGLQEYEEALLLEALEHSLELERLEVRERQVAVADDVVTAREAKIQQEVDQKVEKICEALAKEYHQKLSL